MGECPLQVSRESWTEVLYPEPNAVVEARSWTAGMSEVVCQIEEETCPSQWRQRAIRRGFPPKMPQHARGTERAACKLSEADTVPEFLPAKQRKTYSITH